MNEKEIAEIRRRFNPERSNITAVHGCYVSAQGEIVSRFGQSLASAPQEETESILSVMKRSLSGTLGRQLTDIVFDTQQVVDSEEHRLLMALRDSGLKDEGLMDAFYQRVMESLTMEGPYLILLAHDKYDVPYRMKDGAPNPDGSCDVFTYVLCSICPVKETKPALRYDVPGSAICSRDADWLVSPPELGFMFPAFDDRAANIYNALYYTRKTDDNHPEFVEGFFKVEPSMPADMQQETFKEVLAEALEEECSYSVVQELQGRLTELVEDHKARKDPEPLTVSKGTLGHMLEDCGVAPEKTEAFMEKYDEAFDGGALSPVNIMNTKEIVIEAPGVTIKVEPDYGDLVETKIVDGRRYIMVRVEGDIEFNGLNVQFESPAQE